MLSTNRTFFISALTVATAFSQELGLKDYLHRLEIAPGTSIEQKIQFLDNAGVSLSTAGLRDLKGLTAPSQPIFSTPATSPQLWSSDGTTKFLGTVNANSYDPNSVANPYGQYGSPYSPNSVNNPYGAYGSPYSPYSANNPYTTQAPKLVTPNGNYLGRYSANPYDPDSTANPFGVYGSPYSPKSINNQYGPYGSPFSPGSSTNAFGTGGVIMPSLPALPKLPALPSLPSLPSLSPLR
jgi:hypothetical protein